MADKKIEWLAPLGAWCDIRFTCIQRPGQLNIWDRVRKHQVELHHTHYYSDEDRCWYEIDRSDPYWKKKEDS